MADQIDRLGAAIEDVRDAITNLGSAYGHLVIYGTREWDYDVQGVLSTLRSLHCELVAAGRADAETQEAELA